jgi:hypothetical protein
MRNATCNATARHPRMSHIRGLPRPAHGASRYRSLPVMRCTQSDKTRSDYLPICSRIRAAPASLGLPRTAAPASPPGRSEGTRQACRAVRRVPCLGACRAVRRVPCLGATRRLHPRPQAPVPWLPGGRACIRLTPAQLASLSQAPPSANLAGSARLIILMDSLILAVILAGCD